jgi:hypothetical protein
MEHKEAKKKKGRVKKMCCDRRIWVKKLRGAGFELKRIHGGQ